MKRLAHRSLREYLIAVALGLVVLVSLAFLKFLRPAAYRWQTLRELASTQEVEHHRLHGYLRLQEEIGKRVKSLGPAVEQSDSDEITLSNFLRKLETLAHHPSLTLINMKPESVKDEGGHKIYSVKLSINGHLQGMVRFIANVTGGNEVTGVEAFSLRSVRGQILAQGSFSLWMVRLAPKAKTVGSGEKQEPKFIEEKR